MSILPVDTSTINMEALHKLPVYHPNSRWHLQEGMGNGCAGDPPGYPSYFTRCVYNGRGDSLEGEGQPQLVMFGHVVARNYDTLEHQNTLLRSLWLPLPLEHPRAIAWIRDQYRHMHSCYSVPHILEYGRPKVLTRSCDYRHREFVDDPRFSDEWRIKERAAVAAYNEEQDRQWALIAVPENHMAVRHIRECYPEYAPDLELIAHPPKEITSWWEIHSRWPELDECPGETHQWGRMTGHAAHPVDGTWCQVCGWRAPKDQKETT